MAEVHHFKMLPRQDLDLEMRVLSSFLSCNTCSQSRQDMDPEDDKAQQKELEVKFQPLTEWLKEEAKDIVRNGDFIPCSLKRF